MPSFCWVCPKAGTIWAQVISFQKQLWANYVLSCPRINYFVMFWIDFLWLVVISFSSGNRIWASNLGAIVILRVIYIWILFVEVMKYCSWVRDIHIFYRLVIRYDIWEKTCQKYRSNILGYYSSQQGVNDSRFGKLSFKSLRFVNVHILGAPSPLKCSMMKFVCQCWHMNNPAIISNESDPSLSTYFPRILSFI